MSAPQDVIDQWQGDIAARIGTSPLLSDIVIIEERSGTTETDVDEALKLVRATGGKKPGIAVLVLQPTRTPEGSQLSLQYEFKTIVRVIEIPRINRKPNGANKWASTISLEIDELLHTWTVGNASIYSVTTVPYNDGQGGIGFTHVVGWNGGIPRTATCKAPVITLAGGSATIANNESGATVYFTTDGSTPTPTNGAAYSAPFAVSAGVSIRAAAYKTARRGSNISETAA